MRALKAEIRRLQQELAHLQSQLTKLSSPGDQSVASALRGQVASISSAIEQATAALSQLMLGSGKTGGLVNEQA